MRETEAGIHIEVLTLDIVHAVVTSLCEGLHAMAEGKLREAADLFSRASSQVERTCQGEEQIRFLTVIDTRAKVRDLVLGYVPSLLEALKHYQEGREAEALDLLRTKPAGLSKAATFLYSEASRELLATGEKTSKDLVFESSGPDHLDTIRTALAALRSDTYNHALICEVVGTDKFLEFWKAQGGEIELHLPFEALNEKQRARADIFFGNMRADIRADRFVVHVGVDLAFGARLAVGMLDVVYDLEKDYELTIEVM